MVPDRKSNTIYEIFEKYITKGSLIITDGYPSYPTAVKKFNSFHVIVNHTEGFKNSEDFHTNSIENLWSHLKKDYWERAGLYKTRLKLFLKEFQWLKLNLKSKDNKNIVHCFSKIIIDLNKNN
ncbi:hypothetical protein H311_01451 [Anncaliia algerae PRA109]|nr:hypothetical protein H311_01451 [Anncaliia algerae PRA109]